MVPARAELTVAAIFGDHMVLQRDAVLPVWGHATPKEKITVQFAAQKKTTICAADGTWKVTFGALTANAQGQKLTIGGAGETTTFRDILIGEVWVCAGQSNMEFAFQSDSEVQAALETAAIPNLRLNLWRYTTQGIGARAFSPAQLATLHPDNFYRQQWELSSAHSARDFSAIGWFVGRELQRELKVPVGVISLAVGGSPAEAWMRRAVLADEPLVSEMVSGNWLDNPHLDDWVKSRAHQNLDQPMQDGLEVPHDDLGPNHGFKPTMLWQAGIEKLMPFAIRGVLWYQGESNALEAWRVRQHETLFPLLVRDWRAQWKQGDFPFYWVQLSGISTKNYQSQSWPEFRDQQRRMAAALPNSGFAVSSDLSAENNVHPTNKHDVAHRLAQVVLAQTYGRKIEYSGPAPAALKRVANTLVVTFQHAQGLRAVAGAPLRGFEIAGADGEFKSATAKIAGQTVVLSSPQVLAPQKMRYAWQPFPDANLENNANLPASTFELSLP